MDAREIQRLGENDDTYWWHRAKTMIARRVLRRHVEKRGRVLDVGCGTGATTQMLAEFGDVLGADLLPDALTVARERGVAASQMDVTRLAVSDESFDLVVALDVIEHVLDDAGAAGELRRVLRPGGLLLVSVPAYQLLWSNHDVALGHHRRYRRSGVSELLKGAELEVLSCSYVMTSVLPPAAVVRLSERLFRRNSGSPQSGYVGLPRILNSMLAHVVGAEGFVAGRIPVPFGLSVLAVARRPARAEATSVDAARPGTGTGAL